ncbi:hypothetical protein [Nonomuraea soli]|uniref:LPXTG cell wall anchor domain-containing protein n=1 Tax=Nonomuraea soli TaxID=1032476 RepID=A0A7W0CTJ5_9ACTN|nr:hypothetical protein [Nonomuraea soli]MBA2897094.1 hypothetical protein [Nonomuraea soli]
MLTSKAWLDRLVKKSSALGASVVLATSFFAVVGTAQAAHADTTTTCNLPTPAPEIRVPIGGTAESPKTVAYTCGTELLSTTTVSVKFSVTPTTVPTGGQFTVSAEIPALTLKTAPTTAGTMQVDAAMTVTGGTPLTISGNKAGGALTVGSTAVPTATITNSITATGTEVVIKPGILKLTVPSGSGGGTNTDIVEYDCLPGLDGGSTAQPVDIKVTLTVPATGKTNEDLAITWAQTYDGTSELIAPTTLPTTAKMFVFLDIAGISPTTATGESTTAVAVDASTRKVTLQSVPIKFKPTTTGTATIKPGKIVIGTSATATTGAITCTVTNATELKSYTSTISSGSASPSASATASNTPNPTTTRTVVVTKTPVGGGGGVTKTPKAGAETGGGGELGPDGRMFVLTGSVMIAAAGVGGLMMRRRRTLRG